MTITQEKGLKMYQDLRNDHILLSVGTQIPDSCADLLTIAFNLALTLCWDTGRAFQGVTVAVHRLPSPACTVQSAGPSDHVY